MKTLFQAICILIFLCFSAPTFSQITSIQDSINTFYDSLFAAMQKDYLFRDSVVWEPIKSYVRKEALTKSTLEESLQSCTTLFDTIKAEHCQVFSETGWYAKTPDKVLTVDDFSYGFLKKYEKQPGFELKVLDNNYGYVLNPGMLLLEASKDSISLVAQNMYDEILQVHQSNTIKGWIIDLRFNIGGNVYPMLAALYHFLGDHPVYNLLGANYNVEVVHRLQKGNMFSGDTLEAAVNPILNPDTQIPIALLTGKLTASAGEDIVVGFRGRENVITIGEETAGLLTGNDLVKLPFGIKMALTTGFIANRHNLYTKNIIPDLRIQKQDDFEDLNRDQNILAAKLFIDSASCNTDK